MGGFLRGKNQSNTLVVWVTALKKNDFFNFLTPFCQEMMKKIPFFIVLKRVFW